MEGVSVWMYVHMYDFNLVFSTTTHLTDIAPGRFIAEDLRKCMGALSM